MLYLVQRPGARVSAGLVVAFLLVISSGCGPVQPDVQPRTPGRAGTSAAVESAPSASEVSPSPHRKAESRPEAEVSRSLPPGVPVDAERAIVARNVDGDTIWVEITEPGGSLHPRAVHKIRILEIDTPESTNRTDCFGVEASEFAKAELPVGSSVYLQADRQDKDRYGRFLRYVWDHEGEFYNEKAVRLGYAKAVLYMPNDRYINQLRQAEAEAIPARRGLWAACSGPPQPGRSKG